MAIEFRFVQMARRLPLPFQEQADYLNAEVEHNRFLGMSFLIAMFSSRHVVSSFFPLPFENWNEDAAAYVRFVQAELPFRISDKRWKRWHLNKAAVRFRAAYLRFWPVSSRSAHATLSRAVDSNRSRSVACE